MCYVCFLYVFLFHYFFGGVLYLCFVLCLSFFCLYLLCTWARPVGRARFILCKFVLIIFNCCLLIILLCFCLSIFGFVMLGFVDLYLCVFGCEFFVLLIVVLVWFDGR